MADQLVKVGLVQLSASEDKAENLEKTIAALREAAGRGARLVCLQELFATRYFCQSEDSNCFDLAESIPGPATNAIAAIARECGVAVIVPLFERRAAGLYHNSVCVLDERGEVAGLYRKMHIPDDPQFYEKFYFTPGDLGFSSFGVAGTSVGPLICWDQWYPEAARLSALRGAEILAYPTAIGWLPSEKAEHGASQLAAWQTIQRAHAIANGVFVVAVNRVGFEPAGADTDPASGIEFWGHSFVCDPFGNVIAEAGTEEAVLVVDCDLSLIEQVRRTWPFLRDRRIDAYADITRRYVGRDP
jgi:N-carbamoylputrescine amidase